MKTLAIVMAGGAGERLRPLTQNRAKPAVPFGGKYRLIDFTLSNCINSGIRSIFVLTQYKSASLNRHLHEGWNLSASALGDYVYTVPAQQKLGLNWYRGTADAVRQNLDLIDAGELHDILILSGDHVYKMDYAQMLRYHVEKQSSLTISVLNVKMEEAVGKLGVLEVDSRGSVISFEEKPESPKTRRDAPGYVFASMGIYVFNTEALLEELKGNAEDFGKEVIPAMIARGRKIVVYPYEQENCIGQCLIRVRGGEVQRVEIERSDDSAYWRDVGNIDSYFEASMDLLGENPLFDLHGPNWPIRTTQKVLPPSKCIDGSQCGCLVADGSVVMGSRVDSSILFPEVIVGRDSIVESSVLFNNVLVGPGVKIRRAIIDKDVVIHPEAMLGYDHEADTIRGCTVSPGGVV
ncbi:MAG: glucose-1-phosphate adenylyltransferase, partial [Chloroflexi bacterium]|nr:glucose-1-phosphate adenylyltransferase [Chloroflexota bacterium]